MRLLELAAASSLILLGGHIQAGDSIDSLIKKLGSGNFKEREAASKQLLDRPEAAPILRKMVRAADVELAKCAALILDHFEREPLRQLQKAVKDGDFDRIVKPLSAWPQGKLEQGAWDACRDLVRRLLELHEKDGGSKLEFSFVGAGELPMVRTFADRIRESKRNPGNEYRGHSVFFRATEVSVVERDVVSTDSSIIVAAGLVRLRMETPWHSDGVILAGGNVEISSGLTNVVIVSGGDVTLGPAPAIRNSLIIARGKVTSSTDLLWNTRIISGKTVSYARKPSMKECKITENEAIPLGFVRFGPAGQKKAVEAAKDGKSK